MCCRSIAKATQPNSTLVETMRPEPLRRLLAPVPAALSEIAWSSNSAAIAPVATVTVAPTGTLRNAPDPLGTELRSAPVSSKTSSPMSMGPDARLVHTTAVSTPLFLMTAGMTTENCAGCPSLKVGSGVSITPAEVTEGSPRSATTPAVRLRAVCGNPMAAGGRPAVR